MHLLYPCARARTGLTCIAIWRQLQPRTNGHSAGNECMNRMHKPRDLPSLDLLKAFEAAARRLSFTKAGAELFLSQSAVSRQIQQLEEQLGVQLFLRRTRALLLTDAGQRYFRAVAQVLEQLRDATVRLGAASQARTVTVTTTVTFAALWLVPRLADLQEKHPEVAVHVA